MQKGRYIYRVFETRDGEREYSHKHVEDLQEEKTVEEVDKLMDEDCSTFWGENTGEERKGEYWFFGEIITRVYTWQFITKEEYDVLYKYIF